MTKLCRYGHDSPRNKWGKCMACTREIAQRWRANNPEQDAAGKKAYARANADKINAYQREWRRANPGKHAGYTRKWNAAHPEVMVDVLARRRAVELHASPAWADKAKIKEVYVQAMLMRRLGFDMEVDHVVPLQGKDVSGLHVHNNLRIVHRTVNRAKGNRHGSA